jgi:hypothetical protein
MCEVYVHEKFDDRKVLPRRLWPFREDAKYFLHLVYQHGLLHHGAVARKDREVCLKYDYLTKIIDGRQFGKIRDSLEDTNWLRCDHEYISGEKSFSYSLGPKAVRGQFRQEPLTKQKLINKIENWQEVRANALTDTMRHIVEMLPRISLDEDETEVCLQQGSLGSRQALVEQFTFIRNGCWFATCCEAGRLYTNITSLRTDGRNALRVDGSGLNNVDVSDSQFLALVLLVENFFHGRPLDYIQAYTEPTVTNDPLLAVDPFTIVPFFPGTKAFSLELQQFSVIPNTIKQRRKREGERGECHTTSIKKQKTPIQGRKTEQNVLMSLQSPEWTLFRELVEAGKLKDYVSQRLRTSRNRTKSILMKWIFGAVEREAKVARRMEEVFPELFQFIRQIKQGKRGNKLLAHRLTRIESKLVIDQAAYRIRQEQPDMFFTTIHDSIMVEPCNVSYVADVLADVYGRQGLGVHLKVETEFKRKS